MIVAVSILAAAGALSYSSFKLGKHSQRNLKEGNQRMYHLMFCYKKYLACDLLDKSVIPMHLLLSILKSSYSTHPFPTYII